MEYTPHPYQQQCIDKILTTPKLGLFLSIGLGKTLVRERSEGKINIKVYPNAQLTTGKQTNAFMLLRNGTIDFACQSTINYSPQIPELNLCREIGRASCRERV